MFHKIYRMLSTLMAPFRGAIYFDGALPEAKTPVRISRLQQYLNQLIVFHATFLHGVLTPREWPQQLPSDTSELFSIRHVPGKLKALPAAPFLVPAVIEALAQSKYGHLVSVVSGEADVYCAQHVKRTGGIVITGDSDLLLYDIGRKGSVAFYSSFSLDSTLKFEQYEPAAIARRLQIGSLSKLGFVVKRNRGKSLNECKLLAQSLQNANKDYLKFKEEYEIDPNLSTVLGALKLSSSGSDSVMLDPRVAEYMQQRTDGRSKRLIYLPFLLDDPSRSSAWASSAAIRRLAYSVEGGGSECINGEFLRRGQQIGEVPILNYSAQEVDVAATELVEEATTWRKELSSFPTTWFWISYTVFRVCKYLLAEGKPFPAKQHLQDLLGGHWIGAEWAFMHLSASVQGELYSLRILKQLLQFRGKFLATEATGLSYLLDLGELLASLPSLQEFFSSTRRQSDEQRRVVLERLLSYLGVAATQAEVWSKETRKQAKRKNINTKAQNNQSKTPNNKFDLLSTD